MELLPILLGLILLVTGAFAYVQYARRLALQRALDESASKLSRTQKDLKELQATNEERKGLLTTKTDEHRALVNEATRLTEENRSRGDQLQRLRDEVASLTQQLERRPEADTVVYTIITLGIMSTGKTSLTLKWANPLAVQTTMAATYHVDTYTRTVSNVHQDSRLTTHIFEVRDWSGEHLQDAHDEFYAREIRGMLFVVDLADAKESAVNAARVARQVEEFNKHALRWLFTPQTTAKCKTVVLFINKADLIAGRPVEVEEKAKEHYKDLIEALMAYKDRVNIRVIVGSAETGYNIHLLFAHFIEKILPKNAYDPQLLQKTNAPAGTAEKTAIEKPVRV